MLNNHKFDTTLFYKERRRSTLTPGKEKRLARYASNLKIQMIDMLMCLKEFDILSTDEVLELLIAKGKRKEELLDKARHGLVISTNSMQNRVRPWSGREESRTDPYHCGLNEITKRNQEVFKQFPWLLKLRRLIEEINQYE